MGAPKLHMILIGLVLVGLLATGFVSFLTSGAQIYAPSDFNSSSIDNFNKVSTVQDKMENITSGVKDAESKSGILDVIGSFFTNVYKSVVVALDSIDIVKDMGDQAIDNLPGMNTGFTNNLKTSLVLIAIIIIVVGVFVAYIVKIR